MRLENDIIMIKTLELFFRGWSELPVRINKIQGEGDDDTNTKGEPQLRAHLDETNQKP